MGVAIVTGYTGEAHVTAMDDKIRNNAGIGTGDYIFNAGEKFLLEKLDNNTIRIHSGSGIMQGTQFSIQPNDYEDVHIENGTVGYERQDLICVRYEKNATTAVENVSFIVYTGELAQYDESVAPYADLTHGDLLNGDLINEVAFALIKVHDTYLYAYDLLPETWIGDKSIWFGSCDSTEAGTMTIDLSGAKQNSSTMLTLIDIDRNIPVVSYNFALSEIITLEKTISSVMYVRYDGGGDYYPCVGDITIKMRLVHVGGSQYRFEKTDTYFILESGNNLTGTNPPWETGTIYSANKLNVTFDYLITQ